MVLYLVLTHNLEYPALFISEYINNNRQKYYFLLRQITQNGNWLDWVNFILETVYHQSIKTNQLILEVLSLKETLKTKITNKYNFTYSHELINYLFKNIFYTQSQLINQSQIKSNKTALEYLNKLATDNILQTINITGTKEKIYYCQDLLNTLSK